MRQGEHLSIVERSYSAYINKCLRKFQADGAAKQFAPDHAGIFIVVCHWRQIFRSHVPTMSRETQTMNNEDLDFRTMGSVDMTVLRSVNVENDRALTALSSFLDDTKLSTHVDPETKAILLKLQSSLQN